MQDIVILGAGGQSLVAIDAALAQGKYRILGLVDKPSSNRSSSELMGYEIRETLADFPRGLFFVAVGDNQIRKRIFEELVALGWQPATIVHPSAVISPTASLGAGTIVCAGAIVGVGAQVGANAIINTASTVDHGCIVESHAHLAVGAHMAGESTVKEGAFVGIGAVLIPGKVVGAWATVGAGAVVIHDVAPGSTAVGVPSRPLEKS